MSRNSALLAGLVVLLMGAAGFAGVAYYLQRPAGIPQSSSQSASSVGGPFTLLDQDGRTVTDKDFAGKPFLVFFGYTHCPDVCPATLFELSEALNTLGPDAQRVSALFVSVDPARDTPETLKQYLSNFNPSIRGLTGSEDQVKATTRVYRAYSARGPGEGQDYTVDHTAVVYLMDGQGRFVAPLNTKRPPAEVAADLRRYMS